ncbi:hypothetical protein [Candidatus Mycoplasma haematohominis]|uniref:Uncharacterized protein n=1 Tax=Candidatus Mycoplasma haematohominis TaxID=1494318 RepID=A0A478FQG6_9MOLU|nr:hypothetical protein [Candidatus Mycoplasma haemohominis]GCE63154.1 hypothetical protein MHSWG343_01320 [Candidatus Mycoplasma haemohominis]
MFIALGIGFFTLLGFAVTGISCLFGWALFGSKSCTPPLNGRSTLTVSFQKTDLIVAPENLSLEETKAEKLESKEEEESKIRKPKDAEEQNGLQEKEKLDKEQAKREEQERLDREKKEKEERERQLLEQKRQEEEAARKAQEEQKRMEAERRAKEEEAKRLAEKIKREKEDEILEKLVNELTAVLSVATVKKTEAPGRAKVTVINAGKRSRRDLLNELRELTREVQKALKENIWFRTQNANSLLSELIMVDEQTINLEKLKCFLENLGECAKNWKDGFGCKKLN